MKRWYIGVHLMLFFLLLGISASAADDTSASSTLELLQAEELDTVTLEQPVHFSTVDGLDIVAGPDTYRVIMTERTQLKLVSLKTETRVVVSALSATHREQIVTPIALHLKDDEKFPHVLLLLPDGTALEAVGSYDVVRSRSLAVVSLTPTQIQAALRKKLREMKR